MKITTKNSIYVQKKDLEFLNYTIRILPPSIIQKVFENKDLDPDDYDKYDFFEFTDGEDIAFFRSLDWLIDYSEFNELDQEDQRQIGKKIAERYDEVAKNIHHMKDKDDDYKKTLQEYTILSYQITTLEDISDINNGLLKIKMPNTKVSIPKLIKNLISKVSK